VSRAATSAGVSRDELEAIVAEHRHVLEEHRRAHVESRVRRHMETRLHRLEARFDQLLDEWALSEELRRGWRAHLHEGAPAPPQPALARPLLFRGAAESGSVVEIRERPDGDYDVVVDGTLVERIEAQLDFAGLGPHDFELNGVVFREVFASVTPAIEALRDFVSEEVLEPPWAFASQLKAEGLIDAHFGLTARGRRALARV
jgi:hypothetical protein